MPNTRAEARTGNVGNTENDAARQREEQQQRKRDDAREKPGAKAPEATSQSDSKQTPKHPKQATDFTKALPDTTIGGFVFKLDGPENIGMIPTAEDVVVQRVINNHLGLLLGQYNDRLKDLEGLRVKINALYAATGLDGSKKPSNCRNVPMVPHFQLALNDLADGRHGHVVDPRNPGPPIFACGIPVADKRYGEHLVQFIEATIRDAEIQAEKLWRSKIPDRDLVGAPAGFRNDAASAPLPASKQTTRRTDSTGCDDEEGNACSGKVSEKAPARKGKWSKRAQRQLPIYKEIPRASTNAVTPSAGPPGHDWSAGGSAKRRRIKQTPMKGRSIDYERLPLESPPRRKTRSKTNAVSQQQQPSSDESREGHSTDNPITVPSDIDDEYQDDEDEDDNDGHYRGKSI